MPRRPRIILAGYPVHIIQRGNNRQACFYQDEDYQLFLEWLEEYADKTGCDIHAYVLMTNHVHLLLTPQTEKSAGVMMKHLGQRYVQYINRKYRRSGSLWEGRFRSSLTQEEDYVMACYRYIELNPVRADMVKHPAEYKWSSYRTNAQGEKSTLVIAHNLYLKLAGNQIDRQERYRELFRQHLAPRLVDEIRSSTNGNYALGSPVFQERIANALGRRVTPGKAGRPKMSK